MNRNDYDDNTQHDYSPIPDPYKRSDGTGWFVGIFVALALLAIGYLVFVGNMETQAASQVSHITDIKPSKKHLGISISECLAADDVCVSKELVLSD